MHHAVLALLATILAAAAHPASAALQTPLASGAKLQLDYDPGDVLGAIPQATLANLVYPPAKGPVADGYPVEPLPVFLTVRGGNTNLLQVGVVSVGAIEAQMTGLGLVAIQIDHPVIEPGDDYRVSLDGVRRAVQYLRANAPTLNLDPERIVMHTRSMGTYLGYGVSFKEDVADPLATDPVARESSRPDYLAARIGVSSLMCFDLAPGPWTSSLSQIVFPGLAFGDSTAEQRLEESPTWWLLNPGLFGRERTPPMLIVINSQHGDACGAMTNIHSGLLGEEMLRALDDWVAQSGDEDLRLRSTSVDKLVWPAVEEPIADWTLERMAEDFGGLYVAPPAGDLTAAGGVLNLRAFGAELGSLVEFRGGSGWSAAPPVGCPGAVGSFAAPVLLGSAVAGADGMAQVGVTIATHQMGGVLEFRALAPSSCEWSARGLHLLIAGAQQ
ncbi:hypothetical protein [Engelhardtia mirabilis]|uniref:Alpha/beta hydrolase family protein n=1 Tax=Engelhardtia mirabilis TaxID=2528011 RepID=A0A518BG90_9BACT|nr:hypothetical protein Pla133_10560 [Planctomycetes bacterium Pla133]QDV00316.1 hypothetical protein Pla86_10550 [Planctomycetes bacterium Pla86]